MTMVSAWCSKRSRTAEAMVLSFEDGFRITMTVIGLGIVMVLLLKGPSGPGGAPSGAH